MDRVLNTLFADEKYSDELRLSYYLLSKELDCSEEKTIELIIKNVKILLLSSQTRLNGLRLLSNLFAQLSNESFSDNCSNILQCTIKTLQESKSSEENILAYKVLTQTFVKIYRLDLPNLTRDLSNCMSTLILQFFSDFKPSDIYYAANCLSACATMFPSAISAKLGFLENKILEAVSTLVDAEGDVETLQALGFCYAKVLSTGNLTVQKYRDFFSKFMNTLAQFLNLYNGFSFKKQHFSFYFENEQVISNVYKDTSDIFLDPLKNVRRLHFLTAAICSLITGHYSCNIPLPIEAILESLNQFVLISNGNIKDSHSIDVLAVGHILPLVYENIVQILKALLTSCKNNLIIYARLVNRIVTSTFDWLNKMNSIEKRSYLSLRNSIYSFMEMYFNIFGEKTSFSNGEQQSVVKHLLANIKIYEQNITCGPNPKQGFLISNINVNQELSTRCTLNAIRVLSCWLSTQGLTADSNMYSLIQNEVIHTFLYIYKNWCNLTSPYNCEKCRQELVELQRLLLSNVPVNITPSLETAIVIFKHAYRMDKSFAIRCLLRSCLDLANSIMSSRITSTVSFLPKPLTDTAELRSLSNVQSTAASKSFAFLDSSKPKETPETFTSELVSEKTALGLPSTDKSSLMESSTKRKNLDEQTLSSKVAKIEDNVIDADKDEIIFEGTFSKTDIISKPTSSKEKASTWTTWAASLASNLNVPSIIKPAENAPTTTDSKKRAEETSREADDALAYFVDS